MSVISQYDGHSAFNIFTWFPVSTSKSMHIQFFPDHLLSPRQVQLNVNGEIDFTYRLQDVCGLQEKPSNTVPQQIDQRVLHRSGWYCGTVGPETFQKDSFIF